MKNLVIGLIISISCSSTYANVHGMPLLEMNSSQELVRTCSEGYGAAVKKINKPWGRFQAADEYTASFGMPGALILGLAVGSPLVLLIPAAYAGVSHFTQNKYEGFFNSEQLYLASQQCVDSGVCEDKRSYSSSMLGNVQEYLKKKGVDISRGEISNFILKEGQELDFCTKKIKGNGVRVLKSFKTLKKQILKSVRS